MQTRRKLNGEHSIPNSQIAPLIVVLSANIICRRTYRRIVDVSSSDNDQRKEDREQDSIDIAGSTSKSQSERAYNQDDSIKDEMTQYTRIQILTEAQYTIGYQDFGSPLFSSSIVPSEYIEDGIGDVTPVNVPVNVANGLHDERPLRTAYYNTAAEESVNHAEAKMFFQRHQLETSLAGGYPTDRSSLYRSSDPKQVSSTYGSEYPVYDTIQPTFVSPSMSIGEGRIRQDKSLENLIFTNIPLSTPAPSSGSGGQHEPSLSSDERPPLLPMPMSLPDPDPGSFVDYARWAADRVNVTEKEARISKEQASKAESLSLQMQAQGRDSLLSRISVSSF